MSKYLIFISLLLASCCGLHTEVKYMYLDITITRIDECGQTTFYYSKGQERINGKIWATYSGINDGFKGYLKFNKGGKVLLLSGDGYFRSEDLDTSMFEYKRIYAHERPAIGESVCAIQLSTRHEREQNEKARTGIESSYKIDDNEWW